MSGASGPGIRFRLPPLSLFKFPPDADPQILPPPSSESKFASPFPIDERIYNAALEPYIPVTIATVYFLLALQLNRINRKSSNRPWWISQTRLFFGFVILHNVFLAIFSGATFVAMLRALRHTWPSHREYPWMGILWPGLRTQNGFAGAADALCKMHGPRGFGDAASYNAVRGAWEVKNKIIKLAPDGRPDSTDVGRLWNEGLAFWGWWFYLSKFYEVVDTLIILMKGKRSSTLQVYHHMGAMLCMWAGIRYMSPPIWMFCFINSGIHTLMYVYYTLSSLDIRVPRRAKKTLTTMQIAQFLIGFTFAAGHLFVEYTIPSSTIYAGKYGFKAATSAVAAAASMVSSDAVAGTATISFDTWLKKLVYRAAGQEGLAENVRNSWGEVVGPEAEHVQQTLSQMQSESKPSFETIPCLDTTGESFAIWLNLFYLAPLTWLFLRFFVRSYSRRGSPQAAHPTMRRRLSKSASDAIHGVDRELDQLGRSAEDGLNTVVKKTKRRADKNRRVSETIERFEKGVVKGYNTAIIEGKDLGEKTKRQMSRPNEDFAEKVDRWRERTTNGTRDGAARQATGATPQKAKDQDESLLQRTNSKEEAPKQVGRRAEVKGQEIEDGMPENKEPQEASYEEERPKEESPEEKKMLEKETPEEKMLEEENPAENLEETLEENLENLEEKKPEETTPEEENPDGENPEEETPEKEKSQGGKREEQPEEQKPISPEGSAILVEKEEQESSKEKEAQLQVGEEKVGPQEDLNAGGLSVDDSKAEDVPSYADKVK